MKLYTHPMSQHSRRVLMLCRELGLEPELTVVALDKGEHRAASFLKVNPAHAVPVLEDDGFVLTESHAIMRYLCQKHGGDRFYPSDASKRALVDQWLDWTHCKLNPPIQTLTIQTLFAGDKRDPALVDAARRDASEAISVLEAGVAARRGIGGEVNLAGIAIATTLALYEICQGDFETAPRSRAWYETLKKLPAFAATNPPMGR